MILGFTWSTDGDITVVNYNLYDYFIMKINNVGVPQWQLHLGGSNDDFTSSIIQTNDGGYLVGGVSASNDFDVTLNNQWGNQEIWIVKLSPSLGVNENYFQNKISIYPNPNSGKFILYSNKNLSNIKVFDIMGKEVWSVGASSNSMFDIDISQYSQGVYYVRSVNDQGDVDIKKLIKE